jgi:hexosaminidase
MACVDGAKYATTPLRVYDYPDTHWRGLMVDVARHFIPVTMLLRTIEAMHVSRFNVLHLHLSDSQSFPLQLEDEKSLSLSQLALYGAFSLEKIYSKHDLRELVEYSRRQGITYTRVDAYK